jgi:hypothetical protein
MKPAGMMIFLCFVAYSAWAQPLRPFTAADGKRGYMTADKVVRIAPIYEKALDFFSGRAAVLLRGKWGFIDSSGATAIPFQYDSAGGFSEGLSYVVFKGKWGFIDLSGRERITFRYQGADHFSHGFAAVKYRNKWGLINQRGEVILPFKYDGMYWHTDSRAKVRIGDSIWQVPLPPQLLKKSPFLLKSGNMR